MNDYKKQMECDHCYLTLRMEVGFSHFNGASYGEFCENCNARLDGPHGIVHYNQKFRYQDEQKKKENNKNEPI
jgi:hypothetical protein